MSNEVTDLFAELGLVRPKPVAVLPVHHQIAQKLHACTEPGSERAHADDALVAATVRRLFLFRGQHEWPAHLVPGATWPGLYALAAAGLVVLPDVHDAAAWVNDYIQKLSQL